MKKVLRFQLRNLLNSPGFIVVFLFSVLFSVACFVINCVSWLGNDIINLPPAYAQYMSNGMNLFMKRIFLLIFPLLACAGYTDSFLYDLNNGSLSVFISRCSKKQYYFSKLTAVFISGFAVIVFAQCFNMLLCMIAFPVHSTNLYSMDLWQAGTYTYVIQESFFLFKELYIFSPYLYFLFYIFISGLAAGLVAVIAFQLSFFVKNRIIVISFMFVVINLLSVFLESRNIGLDICSYMIGYNPGAQSYRDFVITFVLYSIFAVMPTFFAMKRLNNCI